MVTIVYSTGDLGPITNGKYTLRIRFLASFDRENAAFVWFCSDDDDGHFPVKYLTFILLLQLNKFLWTL